MLLESGRILPAGFPSFYMIFKNCERAEETPALKKNSFLSSALLSSFSALHPPPPPSKAAALTFD